MLEELQYRARSGWLAAVATGLVLLGSVPFYARVLPSGWFAYAPLHDQRPGLFVLSGSDRLGRLAGDGSLGLARYWLVAVPLAYLLLAAWFVFRARRTGLQLRWPLYVASGLVLFAGLILTVLPAIDPLPFTIRAITTPLLLLAASLSVLGWVERDRRLQALSAIGVLVAAYVGITGRMGLFVVPDAWPLEPVLSAVTSPQGAVALLGVTFLLCGAAWRPRRP